MTFELLFKAEDIEKRPWKIFFVSIIAVIIGYVLSLNIFPEYASILLVTFITIPLVPVFVKIIETEESQYAKAKGNLFKRYSALKIFSFFFLGIVVTLSALYVTNPGSEVFYKQTTMFTGASVFAKVPTLSGRCDENYLSPLLLNQKITDCKLADVNNDGNPEYLIYSGGQRPSTVFVPEDNSVKSFKKYLFSFILKNNFKLLFLVFMSSFIFGSGAIFLLVWNASVVAVFAGNAIMQIAHSLGGSSAAVMPFALPVSLLSIAPHAIPEFIGFFIGAVAGGIFAVAFIRHKPKEAQFKIVLKDSAIMLVISCLFIVAAAFIEII